MQNPFHLYAKVTVYLGTNEVLEVNRAAWDGWNDGWQTRFYRLPDGRKVRIQKHWIIKEVEGWLSPEEKTRIAVEKATRESEA